MSKRRAELRCPALSVRINTSGEGRLRSPRRALACSHLKSRRGTAFAGQRHKGPGPRRKPRPLLPGQPTSSSTALGQEQGRRAQSPLALQWQRTPCGGSQEQHSGSAQKDRRALCRWGILESALGSEAAPGRRSPGLHEAAPAVRPESMQKPRIPDLEHQPTRRSACPPAAPRFLPSRRCAIASPTACAATPDLCHDRPCRPLWQMADVEHLERAGQNEPGPYWPRSAQPAWTRSWALRGRCP
mmetsp:Transcript_9451/g.22314  ORF Transcript_9451/g.22314 Transcript_9451/m.22314 type:complete len:243 (-) Transcript_9451:686-1414(-)